MRRPAPQLSISPRTCTGNNFSAAAAGRRLGSVFDVYESLPRFLHAESLRSTSSSTFPVGLGILINRVGDAVSASDSCPTSVLRVQGDDSYDLRAESNDRTLIKAGRVGNDSRCRHLPRINALGTFEATARSPIGISIDRIERAREVGRNDSSVIVSG